MLIHRSGLAWLMAASIAAPSIAMAAIDIAPLWNFGNPELSEQRFRAALATASGDDTLILQTQIARTYGLRRDFAKAQALLREMEPQLASAGAEARIRHALETGRTFSSATHSPDSQTPEVRDRARAAYQRAIDLGLEAKRDDLVIDAIHMLAFVDTRPEDQLKWGQRGLDVAMASQQPLARAWEASLRNNMGYALYQMGRNEEALGQFQRAASLREALGNPERTRVAHWMVAMTLRTLKRVDEALAIQLRLEAENQAAGKPDLHVFTELELLYRARGDESRAALYAQRRAVLVKQ
ncbi:tetratricopeptide repeat protein [Caenimonas sp. SL110]|uniref:tetratricopeptide repeat protein n=1 Tax=Caenimonas sp. SL110 TaxID=1450524 RepID=UPI000653BC52|nr:tetratricopeptide repeat protein [Caenimonas sp. SL110]